MSQINRKTQSSIGITQDFDDQAKTVPAWLGRIQQLLYSPDIAPLDFHSFWSLQNSLSEKNFNPLEDCTRHLEKFFAQKDGKFWENGIMKLLEKWQKVVKQNGGYTVQPSSS